MFVIVLEIAGAPGGRALPAPSFADAKLSEDRIKNLFDVDGANYLSNRSQCLVKIDRNIFRRQPLAQY
jgi:hypothetical protein